MSGNNYEDILDELDTKDGVAVKKLVHFMGLYRPKIEIDRTFQRNLKNELLQKLGRKSFLWNGMFSYMSIIATSFLLVFGIWRMWGIDVSMIEKGGFNKSLIVNRDASNDSVGIFGANSSQNLAGVAHERSLAAEKNALGESSRMEKNTPENTKKQIVTPPATPEINLSNEIASISSDIDALISTEESVSPTLSDAGMATAKMSTLSVIDPSIQKGVQITIDYPVRMAVYQKSDAWSSSEQQNRSASGMIKNLEKTISKDELGSIIDDPAEISDMSLEYRAARRSSDTKHYLIPCLKYKKTNGSYNFSPLIRGYTLD